MNEDFQPGRLTRLYRRANPDEWDEFIIQAVNGRHEPVNPVGVAYPGMLWMRYRQTGYREHPEYAIYRNTGNPHYRIRRRIDRMTDTSAQWVRETD